MRKNFYRTDNLFPRGSFLIGIGSILGIFFPYYTFNYSESDNDADIRAMESDFGVVGNDMLKVLNSLVWKTK